jgi:hypothetical protein
MGYPWERVAIMGRIFFFPFSKEKLNWLLRENQKMVAGKPFKNI